MSVKLTPAQKRAKGYSFVGLVGGVEVFLPLSISKAALDIDDPKARELFLAKRSAIAIQRETVRQSGGAATNAPMVFEATQNGNFICKQTGTRQWMILSKAKLNELLSRVKELRAFAATLPDKASTAVNSVEDDE